MVSVTENILIDRPADEVFTCRVQTELARLKQILETNKDKEG